MTVRVLFFSIFRDITGFSEITLPLIAGQNVSDVCEQLFQDYPKLACWKSALLVAVNESYVKVDHLLADGDEVAFMPPVQGG